MMAHQAAAFRALAERRGVGALLMDPGTGKTRVVVDYLGALWEKFGAHEVCITAPLSALDTWPAEFEKWLPKHIPYEIIEPTGTTEQKASQIRDLHGCNNQGILRIVLLTHDFFGQRRIAKGTKTVTVRDRIKRAFADWHPDVLVVDEVHRFKSHGSNRTKTLEVVARHTARRIGLTGTVAPRWPLDFFGQWLIINPHRLGTDWDAFRYTYAKWGGYLGKEPVRWINQNVLRANILADSFVAKKEDVLDLPPVTDVTLPVRLGSKEAKAYEEMEQEAITELPSGEHAKSGIPLTKFLRLRQITGGFVGFEDRDGHKREEVIGRSKAKVAADKTADLVSAGRKVVIFAHFIKDLDLLEEEITKSRLKVPVFRVSGATSKTDRLKARQEFRDHGGPAVFIAQMRTMSLAVNELVCASEAIIYSLSERRDDWQQARDRLNRQGQGKPITFYNLVVPGTIDEVMFKAHAEKLQLEAAVLQWAREKKGDA